MQKRGTTTHHVQTHPLSMQKPIEDGGLSRYEWFVGQYRVLWFFSLQSKKTKPKDKNWKPLIHIHPKGLFNWEDTTKKYQIMTIGGVIPLIHKPWFLSPGLTLRYTLDMYPHDLHSSMFFNVFKGQHLQFRDNPQLGSNCYFRCVKQCHLHHSPVITINSYIVRMATHSHSWGSGALDRHPE